VLPGVNVTALDQALASRGIGPALSSITEDQLASDLWVLSGIDVTALDRVFVARRTRRAFSSVGMDQAADLGTEYGLPG